MVVKERVWGGEKAESSAWVSSMTSPSERRTSHRSPRAREGEKRLTHSHQNAKEEGKADHGGRDAKLGRGKDLRRLPVGLCRGKNATGRDEHRKKRKGAPSGEKPSRHPSTHGLYTTQDLRLRLQGSVAIRGVALPAATASTACRGPLRGARPLWQPSWEATAVLVDRAVRG